VDEPVIRSWATAERQEREQRERYEPEQVFDDDERSGFPVWPACDLSRKTEDKAFGDR
jgi:hypothetical protein